MATSSTTKKASTGAKKTTSTAAKKTATQKPKAAPASAINPEAQQYTAPAPAPVPATMQELERIAAIEGRKAEANIKKAMQDDDLVTIQVPPDPRGEITVFQRTYNGYEVKLAAGEVRELPRFLANAVMKSMKLQVLSDKRAERYSKDGGVDLTAYL
jgi:hypothetical protein